MHSFTAQVWNGSRWHLWRWILVPFRLLNKNTGSFHLSDPSKSLWWNNVISGHVSVVPSKHLDRLLNVQNSAYKLQMFSPKPGSTHPPHQAYGVVAPTLSNSVLVENCKATSLDTFLKKLLETHLFTKAFDLYCPQRFSSMFLCLRIVFNFYFPNNENLPWVPRKVLHESNVLLLLLFTSCSMLTWSSFYFMHCWAVSWRKANPHFKNASHVVCKILICKVALANKMYKSKKQNRNIDRSLHHLLCALKDLVTFRMTSFWFWHHHVHQMERHTSSPEITGL